jgi:hypothetical protein
MVVKSHLHSSSDVQEVVLGTVSVLFVLFLLVIYIMIQLPEDLGLWNYT